MRILSAILLLVTVVVLRGATTAPASQPVHSDAEYAAHVERLKRTLPADFTILIQKPFVIAGDDAPAQVRAGAERVVQWAVDHLKKEYFDQDPVDLIDIYLFKDKASYDKYTKELFGDAPETPFGYYSPRHKALIMNIGTGGGTLVHEIVHPFVAANFPNCPTWFNEGLGSLYEQSAQRDDHIIGLTNWRLAGLQEAIKADKLVPIRTLCGMDSATFYGANRGNNYAQARYLLYYLQEHGMLRDYYKAFLKDREKDPTGYETLKTALARAGQADMDAFQKDWEKWVLGLRFP